MQENLSDTEIIRRYGLRTLAGYPEGLRMITLKAYVEQELGRFIEPDTDRSRGKYRSALWNLDERYPQYVRKELRQPRISVFIPTDLLRSEWDSIEVPNMEELLEAVESNRIRVEQMKAKYIIEKTVNPNQDVFTTNDVMHILKWNVLDVTKAIEKSGLPFLLVEAAENISYFSKDEAEAIYRLKFILDLLTKYRNELMHNKF